MQLFPEGQGPQRLPTLKLREPGLLGAPSNGLHSKNPEPSSTFLAHGHDAMASAVEDPYGSEEEIILVAQDDPYMASLPEEPPALDRVRISSDAEAVEELRVEESPAAKAASARTQTKKQVRPKRKPKAKPKRRPAATVDLTNPGEDAAPVDAVASWQASASGPDFGDDSATPAISETAIPEPAKATVKEAVTESAPPTTSGTGPLGRALATLLPSTSFQAMLTEALALVQEVALRCLSSDAEVKPFGSLLQGTFLEGSDLDLYITTAAMGNQSQGHLWHKVQVSHLQRLMQGLPASFQVKETRLDWHVRVPILILDFLPAATPSGDHFPPIQVDVSMGDLDSSGVRKGHVDRLIQGALSRSPKAACLVLLVKRWAKIEGLNKSFEGHLSPLAWTLLCLYFLVVTDRLQQNALTASGWDVPSPPSAQLCESCVSHEELAEFFDMVAGFQKFLESREKDRRGPMGIRLMPDCRPLTGRPDDPAVFFLEDPAARAVSINGVNVARGVKSPEKWRHLLSRCQGAAKALRAGANPAAGGYMVGVAA
ncbi:unnamed protein product [Symbiodinium sp. KB8]|nr:unnamed protein product [Symbiodinium sp. KB8]